MATVDVWPRALLAPPFYTASLCGLHVLTPITAQIQVLLIQSQTWTNAIAALLSNWKADSLILLSNQVMIYGPMIDSAVELLFIQS